MPAFRGGGTLQQFASIYLNLNKMHHVKRKGVKQGDEQTTVMMLAGFEKIVYLCHYSESDYRCGTVSYPRTASMSRQAKGLGRHTF